MKAVLQAGWLLTVAVGNIIVLIVAEAGSLSDQVYHMNCSIFFDEILVKCHLLLASVLLQAHLCLCVVAVGRIRTIRISPGGREYHLFSHGLLLHLHGPDGN